MNEPGAVARDGKQSLPLAPNSDFAFVATKRPNILVDPVEGETLFGSTSRRGSEKSVWPLAVSDAHLVANSEVLRPLRGDLLAIEKAASSDSVVDADKNLAVKS